VDQADGEHQEEGDARVVAVPSGAKAQHQDGDQHEAEGFHDADDRLVAADQIVQPAIGRGFEREDPQHAGHARETERQPEKAECGQDNQGWKHKGYIAEI
jgi:hypothetical protein